MFANSRHDFVTESVMSHSVIVISTTADLGVVTSGFVSLGTKLSMLTKKAGLDCLFFNKKR